MYKGTKKEVIQMESHKKEVKIRISESVYRELKQQAEELGLTISAYVTHLILIAQRKVK